ncbi:MAG: hypothetical protein NXI04_07050 [Planctomycetaceae bacterium]|nr:hypothetical protein [Planctomycetaceae bacterium]
MFAATAMAVLVIFTPDETVFSGPQPGEEVAPFELMSAFGENSGDVQTVANDSGKPQLLVFLHQKSRPAFGVSVALMKLAADRRDKLDHAFVYLTDDPSAEGRWLSGLQRIFPKGMTGGVFAKGIEGPEAYGLNRNVTLTVLVADKGKVTANFALVQPSLQADAPKMFQAIADVLGEKEPPKVSDYSVQGMRRARPADASGKGEQMRAEPSGALRALLRPVLNKSGTQEEIAKAAQAVIDHTDTHPADRQQIGDIARRIIAADRLKNYGNEFTQSWLKKWAKEFQAKPARRGARNGEGPKGDPS